MPGPHPEPLVAQVRTAEAATRLRAQHGGFFVMPNPFDAGTARILADHGFVAFGTSSAALPWTSARPDGEVDRATARGHAADIAAASGLPVNGDFESGYGLTPAEVADTVGAAIDAGVAGCSLADLSRERPEPLFETAMACRRLEAAREVIERSGNDVVLTGRCEAFLAGDPDPPRHGPRPPAGPRGRWRSRCRPDDVADAFAPLATATSRAMFGGFGVICEGDARPSPRGGAWGRGRPQPRRAPKP